MQNNIFLEAHISDIHFGAMDPLVQYRILREQFLDRIQDLNLDIISINGDLFDRKVLANTVVMTMAHLFINDLVEMCKYKGTTLLLIHGTESHDAHQLNNFYHLQSYDKDVLDVRIIEHACFEYIKGKTVLIIPEEYNKGYEYYRSLFASRDYDACYMHSTFVNSIPGKNQVDLNSKREPVFGIENFWRCRGPIISGHVHVAHCYNSHFYYTGSPYRWCFGEEEPKGFMILCHDLNSEHYYLHFEEITSFRYDTIDLDDLLMSDPNEVIKYLNNLKESGIDHIKLKIRKYSSTNDILKEYYRDKDWIKIDDRSKVEQAAQASEEMMEKYSGLDFLYDPNIDEYTKFVMYVNHYEGENFVTVDKLKKIIEGGW